MPAVRLRKRSSKIALGVGIVLVMAGGIAGLVHVLVPAPEPAYAIDPATVALTAADVDPALTLTDVSHAGPTQDAMPPGPAYLRQFLDGASRYFMIESALVPPGRTEIDQYSESLGIQPSDPPTIFGPFVAEHHGFFEVSDIELSYRLASAAHSDYLVSRPGPETNDNYMFNYDNWRTYPIQLGDEADAWSGIRRMPTDPPQAYEELTIRIRWRQGPIVSTLFIRGAHDLTFDSALHLARIVDARTASVLRQAPRGAFHASNLRNLAA